jgi:hypothetical protein
MFGMIIPKAAHMYPRICKFTFIKLTKEAGTQLISILHLESDKIDEVTSFISNNLCLNTKKKSSVILNF